MDTQGDLFASESLQTTAPCFDQARLNIDKRNRTSHSPWRGQFSPELIEHLIDSVCANSKTLLDPFCGSGTVLYEALRKGLGAVGAEVNPAAWHLSNIASFSSLSAVDKRSAIKRLRRAITELSLTSCDLTIATEGFIDTIHKAPTAIDRRILAAAFLRSIGDGPSLTAGAIPRGGFDTVRILDSLLDVDGHAECLLSDARLLPLEDASVDGVITSPPYINVFNYHQNYRPGVELLGWQPLEAASSEIGANRKHRSNRFLTVIQYCLDMAQVIAELSRVMQRNSPMVIILGRSSSVLGVQFQNGGLISRIITESGAFRIEKQAERVFTNRFGAQIYEDIFVARCIETRPPDLMQTRKVARDSLVAGLSVVPDKNRSALEAAILNTTTVQPSPSLSITVPKPFDLGPGLGRMRYASN